MEQYDIEIHCPRNKVQLKGYGAENVFWLFVVVWGIILDCFVACCSARYLTLNIFTVACY